jgi:nucleotide-binding universal stress UspA family protein
MAKKLLVAVDDSTSSYKALYHAIEQQKTSGDSLTLINIVYFPKEVLKGVKRDMSQEEAASQALLESHRARAAKEGARCEVTTKVGDIAREVARYADEQGFDEIIVGHQKRSGIMKVVHKSQSRAIEKRSQVPLTVITEE